ncbi:MAG: phosphopyruvate hydratase [Candidatus Levybacteria bacterium]|nr:phosphopyruvate hydratase [Candidatus Levybacteria bacterium]
MKIIKISARQILDSRGIPTVEVDIILENGIVGRAAVPSGASTGKHEAVELREPDLGVGKAIENINGEIAKKIIGMDVEDQKGIDKNLIEIDGTEDKSHLGANAILGVSLAAARAASYATKQKLFKYIGRLSLNSNFQIPKPLVLLMEGGRHGNWATDIQEFMIVPKDSDSSFAEILYKSASIFRTLEQILIEKGYSTGVGFEGGFCPRELKSNEEAFEFIIQAIDKAGYEAGNDFSLAIDFAASEFYQNNTYYLRSEDEKKYFQDEWKRKIIDWTKKYPIKSLEDPFSEDEWGDWSSLVSEIGEDHQIVGDDLTTTSIKRIKKAIDEEAINSVIVKLNQIGTVTETIEAVKLAKESGIITIVAHRAGETNDYFIADFAVGVGADQCKFGGPDRGERLAKYNELLRIEEII